MDDYNILEREKMKLKLKKNVKRAIFYTLELIFIGLIIFSCIKK